MDGWVVGTKLSSQAIKGIRDKVQIATKFALAIDKDGNRVVRGDPEYVRAACEASLKRLDVEQIDLYYQHRVDTKVPIEITVRDACSSLECPLWVGTSVLLLMRCPGLSCFSPNAARILLWSCQA